MHMPSELDFSSFSINILGRRINCTLPRDVFLHNVFTMYPLVEEPDAVIVIEETEAPLSVCIDTGNGSTLMQVSGRDAFNMNRFRSYIGFLTHYITPAMFLHGCGIYSILRNSGILIVGRQGSGKSTISREIQFADIIDDDQILLHENELIGIGNKAASTVMKNSSQEVIYRNSEHLRAGLGIILALTKEMPGGTIKEISSQSLLSDPSLIWHHNLSTIDCPENYCLDKEIPVVPAFAIGTDENLKSTIETVNEKLEDVLC